MVCALDSGYRVRVQVLERNILTENQILSSAEWIESCREKSDVERWLNVKLTDFFA